MGTLLLKGFNKTHEYCPTFCGLSIGVFPYVGKKEEPPLPIVFLPPGENCDC